VSLAAGVFDGLLAIVGEGAVSGDPADRAAVAHDLWPKALIDERQGRPTPPPDCVVWPSTRAEVVAIYRLCSATHTPVVPFGAGTGVCGASIALRGGVALDTKRMAAILDWDEASGHVRVEPGILGIHLETACLERGLTLGHYPSSLVCSTVGGFLATRSVGQLSTRYGRIDDMVAGLEVVLADGVEVSLAPQPATGAGPDLRRLFLGSEGGFGLIVEATLRLHRVPERRADVAALFAGFHDGIAAAREVMQTGLRPALLRLYDPDDTALQASHLGVGEGSGALFLGACEGRTGVAEAEASALTEVCRTHGAEIVDSSAVATWYSRRYDIGFQQAKYLPVPGAVLDTIEVAAPWSRLGLLYDTVKERLRQRLVVLCHLSHGYVDGACLYFTFAGMGGDEDTALPLYEELWSTVMAAVAECGGTIAHHHGVGLARAPYIAAELGDGGMETLRRIKRALDPNGIANPGKWGLDR
jgi:alkyldihydroxyacetonephosphate synthase